MKKLSEVIREGIGLGLPQFFGDYSGYKEVNGEIQCAVCVLGLCYRVLTGEIPPNDPTEHDERTLITGSHSYHDVISVIGNKVGYDLFDTHLMSYDNSNFVLNWILADMNDNRRMTFEEIAQYLEERGY